MKLNTRCPHIPSVRLDETKYSQHYGNWLKRFDWSYILTLRRHFPLTEAACSQMANGLLAYSNEVRTIWIALERDRRDNMNHLHMIVESGKLNFNRREMVNALGLNRNPKVLSYFLPVDSPKAVAIYCAKHIGGRLQYHDFFSQLTNNLN